MEKARFIWS